MAIEKLSDGRWFVDIEPVKGKRYRRKFKTKAEALRFETHVKASHTHASPWNPLPKDNRKLSELIDLWYTQHGLHLASPKARKSALDRFCMAIKNPVARSLTPQLFLNYRNRRSLQGISAKTLNNELGYINALYGYLYRTEQITYSSPLSKVTPIKIKERELSFLSDDQCKELLQKVVESKSKSLLLIVRICLETGCRWNEAQTLMPSQIGHARITFTDTKSGKNRTVPISRKLEKDIRAYKPTGLNGRLFAKAIKSFYLVLDKCSFTLPAGQAAHVLRHTYASHFMMNGGDILTLQRILGHSTITLTMRYSHLSPDHLQGAVKYQPKINAFDTFSTRAPQKAKSP